MRLAVILALVSGALANFKATFDNIGTGHGVPVGNYSSSFPWPMAPPDALMVNQTGPFNLDQLRDAARNSIMSMGVMFSNWKQYISNQFSEAYALPQEGSRSPLAVKDRRVLSCFAPGHQKIISECEQETFPSTGRPPMSSSSNPRTDGRNNSFLADQISGKWILTLRRMNHSSCTTERMSTNRGVWAQCIIRELALGKQTCIPRCFIRKLLSENANSLNASTLHLDIMNKSSLPEAARKMAVNQYTQCLRSHRNSTLAELLANMSNSTTKLNAPETTADCRSALLKFSCIMQALTNGGCIATKSAALLDGLADSQQTSENPAMMEYVLHQTHDNEDHERQAEDMGYISSESSSSEEEEHGHSHDPDAEHKRLRRHHGHGPRGPHQCGAGGNSGVTDSPTGVPALTSSTQGGSTQTPGTRLPQQPGAEVRQNIKMKQGRVGTRVSGATTEGHDATKDVPSGSEPQDMKYISSESLSSEEEHDHGHDSEHKRLSRHHGRGPGGRHGCGAGGNSGVTASPTGVPALTSSTQGGSTQTPGARLPQQPGAEVRQNIKMKQGRVGTQVSGATTDGHDVTTDVLSRSKEQGHPSDKTPQTTP